MEVDVQIEEFSLDPLRFFFTPLKFHFALEIV
jgi:hypothetical protein